MIRTVTGDIEPAQLGFTYCHEHLIGSPPPPTSEEDPDLVIRDEDKAVSEAQIAWRAGVRSLYEASAWDYGRNPEGLRRISETVGLQIIACAGFNKGKWFADRIADRSLESLEDQIVTEVTVGMDGTDVPGGVIKFGTGYNHISPIEERVIRAAARAHRRTGVTLHSHTESGTMALEQIDILREEGVDLSRVGFVHLLRNPDPWLHRKVAATGAYLCYDGFSKIKYYPESTRTDMLILLVEAGYEHQLLIGGDLARRSDMSSYTGGPGLGYIAGKWLPRLREELQERGYDSQRVEQLVARLFVTNPAEYFDMIAPY
jgi:predicted metal-dependent phosphotriesterase family hydrolase